MGVGSLGSLIYINNSYEHRFKQSRIDKGITYRQRNQICDKGVTNGLIDKGMIKESPSNPSKPSTAWLLTEDTKIKIVKCNRVRSLAIQVVSDLVP